MRLYGGRLIKSGIQRQQDLRVETRDAVLYDVDSTNRIARVKIQGSDTLIYARYPENWESAPSWLKPGNAVRIMHTGGNRSRVELIGHGQFIPTPQPDGTGAPGVPMLGDHIIDGCELRVGIDEGTMIVLVNSGSVMINEDEITLGYVMMSATSPYTMGNGGYMGDTSAALAIAPAEEGVFRYDRVVVGTDGIPHIVTGTGFSPYGNEIVPGTPADHISLGYILVYPNMVAVTSGYVNKEFTVPVGVAFKVVKQREDLPADVDYLDFSIWIVDQYGNNIDANWTYGALSWQWLNFDFSFIMGNGTFSIVEGAYVGPAINESGEDFSTSWGGPFTNPPLYMRYTKDTSSAMVAVTCKLTPGLETAISFVSYDEEGVPLF